MKANPATAPLFYVAFKSSVYADATLINYIEEPMTLDDAITLHSKLLGDLRFPYPALVRA